MQQLELAAARYRLDRETGESLRDLGVVLLSAGREGAVSLAIVDDLAMAEVGPVFERVCRELGQAIPSADEAVDIVIRALLSDIALEAVPPRAGLQRLMDDVGRHVTDETASEPYRFAGESRALQHLVGAYWSYDELRTRPRELSIDGKFGDDAIALLDQKVIGFARDWLDEHAGANTLRMAAVAPSDEDESALLWADEHAIGELIGALRSVDTPRWSARLTEPPVADQPRLNVLVLLWSDGPVRIETAGERLVMTGAAGYLRDLADFLTLYAEHNDLEAPGMHTHVDRSWSIPPDWLATNTAPLRISGWVPEV
jgi:hypothetical protein